jgi:hypothetical protein
MESLTSCGFADSTYVVNIELTVPGAQIRADSLRVDSTGHASLYHAMRHAYENAGRQLRHLRYSRMASH